MAKSKLIVRLISDTIQLFTSLQDLFFVRIKNITTKKI